MLHLTGKSFSEALIFASTNPQYDDRFFIELQVQYLKIPSSEHGEDMWCTKIVFYIQNNFCTTKHALPMFCKKRSFWQRFTCILIKILISPSHWLDSNFGMFLCIKMAEEKRRFSVQTQTNYIKSQTPEVRLAQHEIYFSWNLFVLCSTFFSI